MPRTDQNEASPSLKGLRTPKQSPRACASGRASGVAPYADQNESSLSLRTANCETVNTFVDSSEASPSLGAANWQTAATYVRGLLGGPAESCHT